MSQKSPESTNKVSKPKEGINQQVKDSTVHGGIQAAQGNGNVQIQGGYNVSITLQQFISSQLNDSKQLNFFLQQMGLSNPRQDYTRLQFESFCSIWKSLQAVRLKGDKLWNKVTVENMKQFDEQLDKTHNLILENAIFFEENDYKELNNVLTAFGYYKLNKRILFLTYSENSFISTNGKREFTPKVISELTSLVKINKAHKIKYEQILDSIRISFRQKLSS